MKALSSASIIEQIMVRFVASSQHNQEMIRKSREQYDYLLRKQNDENSED